MYGGTVFVTEQFDDDDVDVCTGQWSAHWQFGDRGRAGPEGVSAQEAIAWGRQQADVVIVEPADGDIQYSAGTRPPPPEATTGLAPWPDGKELPRRRTRGMEHLDRAHDEAPIAWRIKAGGNFPASRVADFVVGYETSLRADQAIETLVVAPNVVGSGHYHCEFTVLATTSNDAEAKAVEATDRAFDAAFTALSERATDRLVRRSSIVADTFVEAPVPADAAADTAT